MRTPFPILFRQGYTCCLFIVAIAGTGNAGTGELVVEDGRMHLLLPGSDGSGQLAVLEWSGDLVNWEPVARDYGESWENSFPRLVNLETGGGETVYTGEIDGEIRYLRVLRFPGEDLDNRRVASRFLQQATFGPTRELIDAFPGLQSVDFNEPPYAYFEQWIDEQVEIPLFSLRAFFRERSNPAFVDNRSAESPYEVGHNPVHGHQLMYNIGPDRYDPDGADALGAGRPENDVLFTAAEVKKIPWYQAAVTGEDALRQRIAWALSQLFVLGENGSNQLQTVERFLSYYDIFIRHAFGNFRDILGEVTFHPAMGYYLTYVDNKAFHVEGTYPDENNAWEVMQLYTIGLWELNPDGTLIVDAQGDPVPTYDNGDIEEFAKIFTGMRKKAVRDNIDYAFSANYVDPMYVQASWHDYSAKTLLDGTVIGPFPQNGQGGVEEINAFLDHLFQHPNTGPFVARLLIQRLTSSNPSPKYIEAVATAFATGTWKGHGSGQRGDLLAVFKAILLHPEARNPALSHDDAHGKLREPLVRFLHYARAFRLTSLQTYGFLPFDKLEAVFAQAPFESPSVFNFYLPDFQPLGPILNRGIYAPEFEVNTDLTSLGLANAIRTLVYEGIVDDIGQRGYSQGELDLTYEISLAGQAGSLVDHLDILLCGGRLGEANRTILLDYLEAMPGDTFNQRRERVRKALCLFSLLPEFNVIY